MRRFLIILSSLILLLTGCSEKGGYLSRDIYAMSTVISLNIPEGTDNADALFSETEQLIYSLEDIFSVTRESSEIALFNKSTKGIKLGKDSSALIETALDVYKNTSGAYDPSCLPITELWNINNGSNVPGETDINSALTYVNSDLINLNGSFLEKEDPNVKIDLGGAAKGYALQKCVDYLKTETEYGMISFGGNVGVWGKKPDSSKWEIGIKDPFDTNGIAGYFKIDEGFVSVSGDYERYFEKDGVRYHHIFDTKTGYPVNNGVHSVAVYTKDAALGDLLSTALFVMGYEEALEFYESNIYDFEALFITDDGIFMTEGAKEIFTEK